ncbi:MAG TPA: signal peptidase I [Gaiellaceae bacterium]|nr:signal peptidase I [Gaiellaceae bacterium]
MSTETAAAPAPTGTWGLAARIASWILVLAAAVVAFALVAVTVGPRVLPYQALVVRSGSMSPTIPTGSIVFYRKESAAKVKVGDVIVFEKPGVSNEKVTHRVYKISNGPTGRYFTTKGDANAAPDDWQVPAVGTGWVASFHIPTIGYILAGLESTLGRLLLLAIPAALLGLITLYEIWRDRGQKAA